MSKVEIALGKLRKGQAVIVQDDPARENEGDLIFPASQVTAENINFMLRYCRGFVCVPLPAQKFDSLDLMLQPRRGYTLHTCQMGCGISSVRGITTGISAADRATTVRAVGNPNAVTADIATPGHIIPLRAHPEGLLARQGHTEAAVALSLAAGFDGSAVLCEIIKDDGKLAKSADLHLFAADHDIPLLSTEVLCDYLKVAYEHSVT